MGDGGCHRIRTVAHMSSSFVPMLGQIQVTGAFMRQL